MVDNETDQRYKDRGHPQLGHGDIRLPEFRAVVLEAFSTTPGNLGYLLGNREHGGMLYTYSKKEVKAQWTRAG